MDQRAAETRSPTASVVVCTLGSQAVKVWLHFNATVIATLLKVLLRWMDQW